MKHLRIFENNLSADSAKNIIKEYDNLLQNMRLAVLEKYFELAEDDNYEPEYGDSPVPDNPENLLLTESHYSDSGFVFILESYTRNGELAGQYYIDLTNAEFEEALLKITAKKYNL